MEPDKYQQAWQAHTAQTRVTVDAVSLLKEVQSHQRNFRALIFWRDFREVVVGLVLIPVWFCLGLTMRLPWTWWLTVPVLLWMIGFMFVYRKRHMPKPSASDQPLVPSVENSLSEVEAQIWLLRNVFWWYLLPPSISISAFFVHVGWLSRAGGWLPALGSVVVLEVVLAVVYGALYFLNQYAVRSQLEPRRQELLTLLASLSDQTTREVTGEYPMLIRVRGISRRRAVVASVCFGAGMLIVVAGILLTFRRGLESRHAPPEKSLFAAMRWQESQPEVRVGDEWFNFASLDGIPVSEIVAFSQRTYGNNWQRRFEEDLVVLPARMGHPPQDKVTFVLEPLKERSPFAAVRWQESQPEVRVGDEWFKLVSLDGIPASEIVAFSQRTFGNRWQMRFEEDLVVLLTRMGHPPEDTVTLVVQSLSSSQTRTLKDVHMTKANRWAIKAAAMAREERSPFAAVRWQESQPEVRVRDEWFKLVSLDGIPASEIVAFSQRTYGNKWQMRFEEDLVVLLLRMRHPPGDTVTLVVQSLTSSQTRTLKDVPMTKANRLAIKAAAEARKTSKPQRERVPPTLQRISGDGPS